MYFPSLSAIVEPIAEGQLARDYLARAVNPALLQGLTQLCKQKPAEPEVGQHVFINK